MPPIATSAACHQVSHGSSSAPVPTRMWTTCRRISGVTGRPRLERASTPACPAVSVRRESSAPSPAPIGCASHRPARRAGRSVEDAIRRSPRAPWFVRSKAQLFEEVANAPCAPGADVVRTAAGGQLHQAHVRVDDVADVGEVTARFEIADLDLRRRQAGLDARDLPREARNGEGRTLSGPGVIERPRDDHVHSILLRGALRELILRQLREAVRAGRQQQHLFADRLVRHLVHLR